MLEFLRSKEMFSCTVTSHHPSMFSHYCIPKETGSCGKTFITIITINRFETCKFRNLGISMPTLQYILSFRHGNPHILIVESLCPLKILLLTRYLINIYKRLIDRAMLAHQQFLKVIM